VALTSTGPVLSRERVLAPDLARGLALLGIALANSVAYVHDRSLGPLARPVDGSAADRVVDLLVGVAVDNRAFPMFTLLFAYGYVMVLRRQAAAGVPWPQARSLLLRRSGWLVAIGAAHLLLLFAGDIVLTYGLLGLALVWVTRWSERVLRLLGWSTLVVFVAFGALDGIGGAIDPTVPGFPAPGTFLGDLALRALTAVNTVLLGPVFVLAFMPPAVIGILLARHQVLEDPAAHLPLLRRLSALLAMSVLGAVPLVLMALQLLDAGPAAAALAGMLHGGTGLLGAVAFVGLVGWFVAVRNPPVKDVAGTGAPGGRRRGLVGAVAAVGERSLTCYLLQSVLFVPLLAPWALGLGEGAGTALVSAVAVAVYLVTLLVAVLLARAGRAGPAEVLLRRLTYRAVPAPGPQPRVQTAPR